MAGPDPPQPHPPNPKADTPTPATPTPPHTYPHGVQTIVYDYPTNQSNSAKFR